MGISAATIPRNVTAPGRGCVTGVLGGGGGGDARCPRSSEEGLGVFGFSFFLSGAQPTMRAGDHFGVILCTTH